MVPWLLAAFFLVGAIGNAFPSAAIEADYQRWGYPYWFHYVTAALELGVAILLVLPGTRLIAGLLGCLVMAAAAGTVLMHGEYTHAIAPLAVFAVSLLTVFLNRRKRMR